MRPATRVFYGLVAGLLFTFNPSMSFAGNISEAVLAPTAGQQFAQFSVVNSSSTSSPASFAVIPGIKTCHYTAAATLSTASFSVTTSSRIKTDPDNNYNFSVTNNSNSDEFAELAIGTFITSPGMKIEIQNSLTVTTSGIGPISITPTYDGVNPSAGFQRELLSTNGGLSFDMADEYGPLGTTITTAGITGFPTFSQRYDNAPNYDYLELLVGFNLSPGATVTLDGDISIDPVPEPSTLTMASMSVFMFVGFKLRSRTKPRHPTVHA